MFPCACACRPFVVWGSCFLCVVSMIAVGWSLLLFCCLGDMLMLTDTDLINAVALLLGIIALPTHVHILCAVINGRHFDYRSKVFCCPLWLCILCVIIISFVGLLLCAHKLTVCKPATHSRLNSIIKHYKGVPKYKRLVDNLQWSLKCCGLIAYTDWFDNDWYEYDTFREYEWDSQPTNPLSESVSMVKPLYDSVPLSCCKSGSCISNYLLELGTASINTRGCGDLLTGIIVTSMTIYLIMFSCIIIVETILLANLMASGEKCTVGKDNMESVCYEEKNHVRNILSINNNFRTSSASLRMMPEDSDEFERTERKPSASRHSIKQKRSNKDIASDTSRN